MAKETIIQYTDLLQKRILAFPFPVQQIGWLRTLDREEIWTHDYGHLEFCFRLRSEHEKDAVDFLDGRRFRTPFPHLFIKPPGVYHHFRICAEREALYLHYPIETVPHFLTCGISFQKPGIPFELTQEISSLIEKLRTLIGSAHSRGSAEQIDLEAFRLIELVLLQKDNTELGGGEEKVREIAAYLSSNYNQTPDIDGLCRLFGISRRSFFRGWNKLYPIPPLEYVIRMRMQMAAHLLETTARPVQEIAEITGYSNAAYFGAVFRKKFGKSPGEYRSVFTAVR